MPITSLCFHYNKKEAYLDHPEITHVPEMEQMALNSLIDAGHSPGSAVLYQR